MKTKSSKKLTAEALDTLKFDVTRYDGCGKLDAVGWTQLLFFRSTLRHVLLGPENRASKSDSFDRGLHLLIQMFERPIGKENFTPIWSPFKYKSVRDADLHSIWTGQGWILRNLPEASKACKKFDEEIEQESDNKDVELPYRSFHSHMLEKCPSNVELSEPLVIVNLRATDDQIKVQFAQWLKAKREEIKSHDIKREIPERFTKTDFRKWHKHRVLAYIDLDLLAYHMGLSLTDDMIGRRLFPDQLDVDTTERVRKIVKPLANRLMESKFIDALDWHAGHQYFSTTGK